MMERPESGLSRFAAFKRSDTLRLTAYVFCTIALALFINWVIYLGKQIRKRRVQVQALKDFPGPKGHWLVGNLRELLTYEDRLDFAEKIVREYPKFSVIRVSPFILTLRVTHPDTIKTILATTEPKDSFGYRFLIPWIGQGLLISTGNKWARNRRLLTPAFHFDILKPYVTIFSQSSLSLTNKIARLLDGETKTLELFEHVSLMTFDSLMKCIFGEKEDFQFESSDHLYLQSVYTVIQLIVKRFLFFPHHNDVMYHLSRNGQKFRRTCRRIHNYSRGVIAQKRKELSQQKEFNGSGRTIDFLDMLLQAKDEDGKGLTDDEIQAEVDTFMFEGHDTTASGISWCLYNLARHPEYQAKCRDEVNSVLGDREHFSWEDMLKLPFLTMCIKESLRLHPPVPSVGRETTKPMTFPDGTTIPAGIFITVSIFSCHHNPLVWENPSVYDPYRFSPENMAGRSPHAFIPFSAGPRNCIGQHFALHEMKVCVGQVLRRLELFEDKDKQVIRDPLLVLKARDGLHVKIKPRQQ